MTTTPYIGVTGFMNRTQVEQALEGFPHTPFLKLMVGVLASDKTLSGVPNSHPNSFPHPDDIAEIFVDDPRVLNLVHYNTHNQKGLARQLDTLFETAGPNCHGAQLNVTWPSPEELKWQHNAWGDKQIVLQLGREAFQSKQSPVMVARYLGIYKQLIDYVLFDMSGGFGVEIDVNLATECLVEYLKYGLDRYFGFGLAGGLDAEKVSNLASLLRVSQTLSVDAQGKLRSNDQLDLQKVRAYIQSALRLYRPVKT